MDKPIECPKCGCKSRALNDGFDRCLRCGEIYNLSPAPDRRSYNELEGYEHRIAELEVEVKRLRKLENELTIYRTVVFDLNHAAAHKPLSQDYIIGQTGMAIERAEHLPD